MLLSFGSTCEAQFARAIQVVIPETTSAHKNMLKLNTVGSAREFGAGKSFSGPEFSSVYS